MLKTVNGHAPRVHPAARAAETAVLAGEVTVEAGACLWYGAVVRGDLSAIRIGQDTNIQDNAVLHCDVGQPLSVGRDVTVGHSAILHSCTVEDECLIGMGATLLNGCVVGAGSLVAAGALVTAHTVIPPGSLAAGMPAKVIRPLRPEEMDGIVQNKQTYLELSKQHFPPFGGQANGGIL